MPRPAPPRRRIPWRLLLALFVPAALVYVGLFRGLITFRFAYPWLLLLVPVGDWPGAVAGDSPVAAGLPHPFARQRARRLPTGLVARLRELPSALRLLAVALLGLALARPQTSTREDNLDLEGHRHRGHPRHVGLDGGARPDAQPPGGRQGRDRRLRAPPAERPHRPGHLRPRGLHLRPAHPRPRHPAAHGGRAALGHRRRARHRHRQRPGRGPGAAAQVRRQVQGRHPAHRRRQQRGQHLAHPGRDLRAEAGREDLHHPGRGARQRRRGRRPRRRRATPSTPSCSRRSPP